MEEKSGFLQKLRRLSPLSLPLCFLSFVFLDFSFRYFYRFVGGTSVLSYKPMLFTAGWALLLTGLLGLLPRLARRIAMMLLILLFSVLTLVHCAMFNIFGNFFTFSDTNFAGDGARFFSWSYLNFRKALLLCIVLAVLMMAFAAFLVPPKPESRKKRIISKSAAGAAALLSLVPILCMHFSLQPKSDTMWWGNTYDPNAETEIYSEFTNTNRCVMLTGLYQYTFRNFTVSFGIGQSHQGADKLDAYYESREVSPDNGKTGLFKDKNLLMVMLESADTWLLTEDYMPNLYALQQKSINFANHYTPLYLSAGTFNTEIVSLTGLIPAVSGLPSRAYSTNSFPLSLPNLFRDAGYTVNSFHSASPAIYSRGSIHTNLGFEAYHSYVDMGMDDYMLDSQLIRAYDQMTSGNKFYSYLITYSGHGPYTEEMRNTSDPHYEAAKAEVAKSGVTGSAENMEEYTLAVAHAMETDEYIGELVDKLTGDGHMEDTVLVFYADHYGKYMSDDAFLKQVKGVGENKNELYRTPFFLYSADQKPETVEKYTSSVDIVPTLVNLFGLDADRRYYVGDDIFGDRGGAVLMPNYAWFDENVYYSDAYQGEMTEAMQERTADFRERVNASWDTLKSDYFATWKGDETKGRKK